MVTSCTQLCKSKLLVNDEKLIRVKLSQRELKLFDSYSR